MKVKRWWLWLIILGVVVLVLWNMLSINGIGDLKGDFKELAVYRNENNTGPVVRIYAVSVADTLWDEMDKYGALMPHTKYGNTKVYFFMAGAPVPSEVQPGASPFDPSFRESCLAVFEKESMGNTTLIRYPFKK